MTQSCATSHEATPHNSHKPWSECTPSNEISLRCRIVCSELTACLFYARAIYLRFISLSEWSFLNLERGMAWLIKRYIPLTTFHFIQITLRRNSNCSSVSASCKSGILITLLCINWWTLTITWLSFFLGSPRVVTWDSEHRIMWFVGVVLKYQNRFSMDVYRNHATVNLLTLCAPVLN